MLIAAEQEQRLGVTDESGCWPTPKQELLLKAALLRGPEALQAWEDWRKIADIEVLDFGSHRMLPKLYRNLLLHRVSSPDLARFRSVYRYYWYQNETLFHRAKELLKSCRAQGVDTMVLKGAAMISLYYKDSGVRPMQDFDLVVSPSHAVRAMELLTSHGWRSRMETPIERIQIRHSTPYDNSEAQQLDLHWHVLGECRNFRSDEGFWRRSVQAIVAGEPTRVLDPTDQLFHICVHGVEWNEVPPMRWIADAMAVFDSDSPNIDWDRFIRLIDAYRQTLPIHDGLSYLQKIFHARVPDRVLESLRKKPVSDIERFGYRVRISPLVEPTTREIIRKLRYECWWLTGSVPIWRRPSILMLWFQHKWKLETRWQLLFSLPFKALSHVFRKVFRHANGDIAGVKAQDA